MRKSSIGSTQFPPRWAAYAERGRTLLIGLLALTLVAGCGSSAGVAKPPAAGSSPQTKTTAAVAGSSNPFLKPPAPGTDVPTAKIRFGMRPYANDAIYVIGMKQGWYKDVGIEIDPAPFGRKVLPDQAIPLLVSHQLDAVALYPPDVIAAMDTVKSIRFIAYSDLFQGFAVLAAPGAKAKTVNDFMKDGLDFKQAMAKAMAQVNGQKFATAPVVDNRAFLNAAFGLGGMDMAKNTELIVTPDANALQLAHSGSVKFVSPTGAPFTAQLEAEGWTPVVTPIDILKNIPGGVDSPVESLVGTPGIAADADWAKNNPDTALRFVSVMFRIIDAEQKDAKGALALELDYINAFAGTNLDLDGLQKSIDLLSPLSNFDFQKYYCDDASNALDAKTVFDATVKADQKNGSLKGGSYNFTDLVWTCDVYHALVNYKGESDKLLKQLEGESLGDSQKATLAKAKQFYAWFDYLDAYRLLQSLAG